MNRLKFLAPGLVLLVGGLAVGQETSETKKPAEAAAVPPAANQQFEGEGYFETIDVNVVNVDVYVTDKQVNRIKGLKKEDFELFEDRKPIAITNFYAIEDGQPVLAPEALDQLPVARPGMPVEIPEDQRLHLVVYIDNFNIRPFNRNRVFNSIREFLRTSLTSEDRVMLMTYDREPHVRRSFTRDSAVVASALY
jgi:VWFA-related protein